MDDRRINQRRQPLLGNSPLVGGTWLLSARLSRAEDRPVNYYERHIGDYIKDTAHLSLLEHGVYTRLLDVYYTREEPLPADQVQRLIGVRSKEEKTALGSVLEEFFTMVDGRWHQKKCEQVIADHHQFIESQKAKAAKRWKSHGNATASAPAMPRHESGIDPAIPPTSHLPLPITPLGENPPDSPSLDQALFQEARKVFGQSIGGKINTAIKEKGKPWVVQMIEACRNKDPEAARAYLAASMKPVSREAVC